jgi:hypothetical protein
MGREQKSAAAEVERLTKLRDEAEKESAEHRELNHRLMKARRRLTRSNGDGASDAEYRFGGRRRTPRVSSTPARRRRSLRCSASRA